MTTRDPVLFTWAAVGSLYPAGSSAWNGQLLGLQSPGGYFTPDVPMDAEEVNWNFTKIAGNLEYFVELQGAAWNKAVFGTTIDSSVTNLFGACWDDVNHRWYVATVLADPVVYTAVSYDGMDTWTQLSAPVSVTGTGITALAISQDQNTATKSWVSVLTTTGGFVGVKIYKQLAGTTTAPAAGQITLTNPNDVVSIFFNNRHIAAIGSITAGQAVLVSSSTDWASRTGNMAVAGGFQVEHWALAANGTICVAVPTYSLISTATTYSTTDGDTWVANTGNSGGNLTALDEISGVAWGSDASGPCFLMVSQGTGGQPCKVFRSPDGINWTLVTTMTTGLNGLCCIGDNVWISQVKRDSSNQRIVVSLNGGLTWKYTNALVEGAFANLSGVLVGSPTQALAMSNVTLRTSVASGQGSTVT